ncbi:MAG: TlpA disulfide reductase family protein [Bacteroidales bacterium]|nr:TlpA family protein disulfide reductase [Bacteroidales bacterium]MDD2424417.1 TlpA disulfide reductase family protein [Bacteroidales bacterium]MDD3988999.1 TlpA disulfide reductase family protein [Bacteroidales bacterium]MDD4638388.1 TlpA disulfide reductase family protein [Bacteroidales bacterium]
MRKILVIAWMLILTTSVLAQQSVIFKGTYIDNGKDKEVEVKENQRTIAVIPVKGDGTFYGEVPLDRLKQLSINYGVCAQPMFVKPGREITVNFGLEPKTAKFSGSPETQLYLDLRFVIYPGDPAIIWKMPWPVYKKYMQDALATKMLFSEVYTKAYPDIPASFRKEVEAYTKYSNFGSMIQWPQFHKQANNLTVFAEEEDWKNHLQSLYEKIEWNDPFLCGLPQYVSFAEYYLNTLITKEEKNGSFLLDAYGVIKSKISNKDVAEHFLFHYTNKYLKDEAPAQREKALSEFRNSVANERYLAQLNKIAEDAGRFGSNADAYNFSLEDVNGKTVSLSDFKGKVVYIDFWATWCAPCRAEIPHLNKLKAELKDNKDIVFICVSTDQIRDKQKWSDMVKEMGMTDYQLFAGDKYPDIKRYYKINGIPHFTIIGKDGKIYKNQTIRPSNPQTKSTLVNLAK